VLAEDGALLLRLEMKASCSRPVSTEQRRMVVLPYRHAGADLPGVHRPRHYGPWGAGDEFS